MAFYQILIVGGGNAGISVAAQLLNKYSNLNIGIIEPSDKHYYQPAWTLVGGGVYDIKDTIRNEADYIPKGAAWIKDSVVEFKPTENQVTTKSGAIYSYDYLIVAPGIQLDWHKIKGLKENLGKNGVTSNYSAEFAPYTWECLQNLKGGNVIFTAPNTPVKCGGAPQKIMYLAADYIRRNGLQNKCNTHFYTGGTMIFGVKKYAEVLQKIVDRNNIQTHFYHNLDEIKGDEKIAIFEDRDGKLIEVPFDMIHVTPPQSAPDFIKNSPLAIEDDGLTPEVTSNCVHVVKNHELGWVDVDKATLRHNRFPNIYSLGDVTNTPNAKTGAAIRKQAPVVVNNLLKDIFGEVPSKSLVRAAGAIAFKGSVAEFNQSLEYTGYSSCPIVTGYGKLMLAEFDYNSEPMETFPFNQAKERWSMWVLKKYLLPWLYWNRILTGRM
jgi:sulfide:quinone oxidoreductase